MSRARSTAIVKANAVPETASVIAEGLHDVADALRVIAGVLAWGAVEQNSGSHGRQKEMAAVLLRFALEGYFSTKVDGVKVSQADQEQALAMFNKFFPLTKGRRY
jgi:hypothetical protein